jgi:hypothetical protein
MDISVFSKDELPIALAAVRAIGPEPSPAQDRFLGAVARLHRQSIDPAGLPQLPVENTARVITDPHRRKRLLQLAVIMTTIDGDVSETTTASVVKLANALGVDEKGVRTLQRVAANQDTLARFDLMRRVGRRLIGKAWRDERWDGVSKIVSRIFGSGREEPEVARRYHKLGLLPHGTFGRALWEHLVVHDFALPGEPEGIPEGALFHDLGHVLSGYETDPDGELQQAFQAGFVRNDGFMFLFFAIAQFHLGLKITPVADAEIGRLDIDKLMTALARGAACKVDLSENFDHWAHFARPLEEVRNELGIPALAARY